MSNNITVSIKFMPAARPEEVHPYVDLAIDVISKWGFVYEVGPSCTTIEGNLFEILKKVNSLCEEMEKHLERFAVILDIDYKRSGISISDKIDKYRS